MAAAMSVHPPIALIGLGNMGRQAVPVNRKR
jgi:hypothetical protein